MGLHESAFGYLKPTDEQIATMQTLRDATKAYADTVERVLPESADRTYIVRKIRECGMWANVAVTRDKDGAPLINE